MLLVDDHELIRQGLARAFERTTTSTVVGEAGIRRRGPAAVRQALEPRRGHHRRPAARRHRARPGQAAPRRRATTSGIVVLTMYAGDEQLFGALEAGASAFVAKDAPSDDVVAAARHARVSPAVLHRRRPRRRHAAPDDPGRAAAVPARDRGAQPARRRARRRRDRPASSTSASRRPRPTSRRSTRSSAPPTAPRRS